MADFKKICRYLDGDIKKVEEDKFGSGENKCIVNGFPMANSNVMHQILDEGGKVEKWSPKKFLIKFGWMRTQGKKIAVNAPENPVIEEPMELRKELLPTFYQKGYENLKERIKKEKPIDPPHVSGLGHEGRHRALACSDVDKCEKIPVVLERGKE